jgi:hypothetical protein
MRENTLKSIAHYNLTYRLKNSKKIYTEMSSYGVPYHLAKNWVAVASDRFLRRFEDNYMARKKPASNYAYNITWKRIEFNPQEKAEFMAWATKREYDLGELLTHVLNDGDRITIKYSDKDDYYYVTIMGTEESHRNSGLGFSSFAKDAHDAMIVALYKYVVLLEGDIAQADDQATRGDFG